MKAVTQVMTVIIIIAIALSLITVLWIFLSEYYVSLTSSGEETLGESLATISSCMKIESVSGNKVYLRNCAEGVLTEDTLKIYLDDEPLNIFMDISNIDENEVGIITLHNLWGLPTGQHLLKVTNPKTTTEMNVEASLHDSCVLALNFDEGAGTIAYDKSGYKNDGTLYNGTEVCNNGYCPKWVDGKFGKALKLDGLGDYVDCGNGNSLSIPDDLTIELWMNIDKIDQNQFFVEKGSSDSDNYGFHICNTPSGGLKDELSFEYRGTIYNHYSTSEDSQINLQTNNWYHVMTSLNNTNVVLYRDGIIVYNNNTITDYPPSEYSNNVFIGRGDDIRYFNGTIDNVRIYNKALTPDETIILKPVTYD